MSAGYNIMFDDDYEPTVLFLALSKFILCCVFVSHPRVCSSLTVVLPPVGEPEQQPDVDEEDAEQRDAVEHVDQDGGGGQAGGLEEGEQETLRFYQITLIGRFIACSNPIIFTTNLHCSWHSVYENSVFQVQDRKSYGASIVVHGT